MHNIIFISTIHKEIGKCNADELCKIIETLKPEVIFLEAVDETYSAYENHLFSLKGLSISDHIISIIINDYFSVVNLINKN